MDHLEGQSSDEEIEQAKDHLDEDKAILKAQDAEASASSSGHGGGMEGGDDVPMDVKESRTMI